MFSTKSKRFHSLEAACACLAARDKIRNSTTFKLAALLSTAVLFLGTPAITVALDSSSPIPVSYTHLTLPTIYSV